MPSCSNSHPWELSVSRLAILCALSLPQACASHEAEDGPGMPPATPDASAVQPVSQAALTATVPSSNTVSRSDWRPIADEWGFHRTNRSAYAKVSPLFKCIDKNSDGSFIAHFGYKTRNKDVMIPVGRFNGFLPAPAGRGQPTLFKRGTNSNDLFTVKSTSKLLAWFVGDDVVVATFASKQCTTPKTCPASCDDGSPCTVDACSKSTAYQCTHVNVSNGASCADGNVCNGAETCQAPESGSASICTPGSGLSCEDQNACTADSCDPVAGCRYAPQRSGFTCTPEAACATAGACDGAGTCQPGRGKNCDDGNPCTADSCDAQSGCKHEVTVGVSCSDGKACNGEETCSASGACAPGVPLLCNDGNECTADSCNDVSGCVYDLSSNQGKTCTASGCGGSTCNGGVCSPASGVVCDDNNPCTVDRCTGNSCSNTPAPRGASCADGDFCNGAETCDGAGVCAAGTAPCASVNDACKSVRCDAATSQCVTTFQPEGTACDDGNACTQTSACHQGSCSLFTAKTCTTGWGPGDQSACDPVNGCVLKPTCEPFLDGNKCNVLDPSSPAGTCRYQAKKCAADGCYQTACNPATGQCQRATSEVPSLYSGGGLERNLNCDDPLASCATPPGGCGASSCMDITCNFLIPIPNCNFQSLWNCGAVSPSTCQTATVTSGVTNSLACQEGPGCQYTMTDCAASKPLGEPGLCQEYVEDPHSAGCCALRPKTCRASDFGLPANTTGYAFSCDASTGACVATPAP
jgi:Dictyostelium (slime mold) repeat